MAKWVISGGTGFVGKKLVEALAKDGETITILTRGGGKARTAQAGADGGNVVFRAWDPTAGGAWEDALAGVDVVVGLAGAGVMDGRWSDARKAEIRDSRVTGTRVLAEAAARAKATTFVSASAVGYYGGHDGSEKPLTEDDPPGTDFLAEVCVAWEKAAAPAVEAGIRVVHPRIGIVLGREGGALPKMSLPFKAFVGGPVGDGAQFLPWIHVRDTVDAIRHVVATPGVTGPVNFAAPNPATMDAFARTLGEVMHRPSFARVPPLAVKLALGEAAAAVLSGQRTSAAKLVGSGYEFRFPDLRAALVDLV